MNVIIGLHLQNRYAKEAAMIFCCGTDLHSKKSQFGAASPLHGSHPIEPVWMFVADKSSAPRLERTSQMHFKSKDSR